MLSILLITVGGSPQPIITAFQSLQPDRVIFICSSGPRGSVSQITGKGTPCQIRKGTEVVSKLPNILTQLGLGDRFNSSTKTLFLALGTVALGYGLSLYLTTSATRPNLIKVEKAPTALGPHPPTPVPKMGAGEPD